MTTQIPQSTNDTKAENVRRSSNMHHPWQPCAFPHNRRLHDHVVRFAFSTFSPLRRNTHIAVRVATARRNDLSRAKHNLNSVHARRCANNCHRNAGGHVNNNGVIEWRQFVGTISAPISTRSRAAISGMTCEKSPPTLWPPIGTKTAHRFTRAFRVRTHRNACCFVRCKTSPPAYSSTSTMTRSFGCC